MGQIYFARERRNQFLNIPREGAVEYSEATAELIDGEVGEIINNQYTRTMEILLEKRDILDNGAKILLEKEKIEGDEFNALMNKIRKVFINGLQSLSCDEKSLRRISDGHKGFCGGSATNSRLRKGDKTQHHNLNHHMEEKMTITSFSLGKETI